MSGRRCRRRQAERWGEAPSTGAARGLLPPRGVGGCPALRCRVTCARRLNLRLGRQQHTGLSQVARLAEGLLLTAPPRLLPPSRHLQPARPPSEVSQGPLLLVEGVGSRRLPSRDSRGRLEARLSGEGHRAGGLLVDPLRSEDHQWGGPRWGDHQWEGLQWGGRLWEGLRWGGLARTLPLVARYSNTCSRRTSSSSSPRNSPHSSSRGGLHPPSLLPPQRNRSSASTPPPSLGRGTL